MKDKAVLIAVKALLNFRDTTPMIECQERVDLARQLLELMEDH